MGKVATTSLMTSLKRAGYDPICCHYLHPSKLDYFIDLANGHSSRLDLNVLDSLALHHYLPMHTGERRLKIISSMRDPIARNISAFYENIHAFGGPDSQFECRLQDFLENYPHTVPLEWWDFELKQVLGFDLFAAPFEQQFGYTIYNHPIADIFIMRADLPLASQSRAISSFLGISNLEVQADNLMSDESDRAESYSEFRDKLILPRAYVDFMYHSDVARYFWSEEQLSTMRAKWRVNDTPWENGRWFLAEIGEKYQRRPIVGNLVGSVCIAKPDELAPWKPSLATQMRVRLGLA